MATVSNGKSFNFHSFDVYMAKQAKYLVSPRLELCNKVNLTLLSSMVLLQYAVVVDLFYMRTLATPSSRPTCSFFLNRQHHSAHTPIS